MSGKKCRFCGAGLQRTFVDLGASPLANSFLEVEQVHEMEQFYPLHAYLCDSCCLVQLVESQSPAKIFSDYAYFSSYSDTWLKHVSEYADQVTARFNIGTSNQVVEIASNDGYLLRYFKQKGVRVLGVEPAANVAKVAEVAGIPTLVRFFGVQAASELVAQGIRADLLIGNNVLAHVPDLNDFVRGMKILLGENGILTMEFPHLLRLMERNQFDTIYHEHFSYFSFFTVEKIFSSHGLTLFDVEELPTHGGSLRIYARHAENASHPISERISRLKAAERGYGLDSPAAYEGFTEKVKECKRGLLEFLIGAKRRNQTIVGYGAPAKGNTLLNYCGVRTDFVDYTVDRNPVKQGKYLPGTHIPIYHPDRIRETKPDYLLILPWNLKEEIMEQTSYIREWGGKYLVPIPEVIAL